MKMHHVLAGAALILCTLNGSVRSDSETGYPVVDALAYWGTGHAINYVGHHWGKYTATDYLHLHGDSTVSTRLTVKFLCNAIGREYFAQILKWFPDASRIDTPDLKDFPENIRNAAHSKKTFKSELWEAGRNTYTMWEFVLLLHDAWKMWHQIKAQQEKESSAHSSNTPAQVTIDADNNFSAFIKHLSHDAQMLTIAGTHFAISAFLEHVAFKFGTAFGDMLVKKTHWTKPYVIDTPNQDPKRIYVSIFRVDPFGKIVESVVTTTCTQFAKDHVLRWLRAASELVNLYDPRYDEFHEHAYKAGSKGYWAYRASLSYQRAYTAYNKPQERIKTE